MFDHQAIREHNRNWWNRQTIDAPLTLNSFAGTFTFEDHDVVPELIRELVLSQVNVDDFENVPITTVEQIANDFWKGPGSGAFISEVVWCARIARTEGATITVSRNAWKLDSEVQAAYDVAGADE
jgi:hypothetical protein